ncbi:protein charybde isoform X2 [Drosophila navojoa]|uniref:protein charybde isoform X2 n=1 Tax=Drosophila navojoa TaxID=7232 RepID=UPI0011BF279E|nr:protein charybde isoform X2 [Drosophila navojoa]
MNWTSPLTAPATATAAEANVADVDVANADVATVDVDVDVDVDVVDGHPASVLHMRQHQALYTRPRLSSSSSASSTGVGVKAPVCPIAASFDMLNGGSATAGYMSNVLQAAPQTTALPASPLQSTPTSRLGAIDNLDDVNAVAVQELSQQLQAKLRDAKSQHLACTEVTLPNNLMQRIAAEIIRMSEREPCGERACTIFIEFESEPNNVRRIASFKVDPDTVSIFELYLTLKQDKRGWSSLLPKLLKYITRSNTIMISPDFTLTKNKLYSPSRGSII